MMDYLQTVALQDAACMLEFQPDRCGHPLFQLPVFHTDEFMAFRTKMKNAVAGETVPFDAQLHAVLPGLQERQTFLVNEQRRYYELLLSNQQHFHEQHLIQTGNLIRHCFQQQWQSMGNMIQNFGHGLQSYSFQMQMQRASASTTSPSASKTSATAATSTTALTPQHSPSGYGHRPSKTFDSVQAMYDEYFGLNAFDGVPIKGGLDALEKRFKTCWRQDFTPGEVQHYSRFCRVVKTVVGIQQSGKTIDNAIKELEPLYSAANKKLSTFVEKLKSKKLVPEKEKGKKGKTS
jgi:hypothetical protein